MVTWIYIYLLSIIIIITTINTWNYRKAYNLLVLDRNTWKHNYEQTNYYWQKIVTLNHIIVYQLLVSDTWYHV